MNQNNPSQGGSYYRDTRGNIHLLDAETGLPVDGFDIEADKITPLAPAPADPIAEVPVVKSKFQK